MQEMWCETQYCTVLHDPRTCDTMQKTVSEIHIIRVLELGHMLKDMRTWV